MADSIPQLVSIETMRSRSSYARAAWSASTNRMAANASTMAAHSKAEPRAMAKNRRASRSSGKS